MEGCIGEIRMFAGSYAPIGWLVCDGRSLDPQFGPARTLFNVIGNRYGGDGKKTFHLPDLRMRFPMGAQAVNTVGTLGGADKVKITEANLPPHKHGFDLTADAFVVSADTKINLATASDSTSVGAGKIFASGNADAFATPTNITSSMSSQAAETKITIKMNKQTGKTAEIGAGIELDITPKYQVVNFIICVSGIYPNRD